MYEESIKAVKDELERLGEREPAVYHHRGDPRVLTYYVQCENRIDADINEDMRVIRDRLIKANQDIVDLCQKRIEELKNASTKS